MITLALGLVLFLGIHLLPVAPSLRTAVAGRLGDKPYRGAFSLVSLVGLVLIVIGYRAASSDPAVARAGREKLFGQRSRNRWAPGKNESGADQSRV